MRAVGGLRRFQVAGVQILTRARRPARVRVTFACGAVLKRKGASSLRLARACSTAVVLFQQGLGRSSAKMAKACGHSAEAACKPHSSTLPSTSVLVGRVNRVLDGFRSTRGCTCEECSAGSRHGFFAIALAGLGQGFRSVAPGSGNLFAFDGRAASRSPSRPKRCQSINLFLHRSYGACLPSATSSRASLVARVVRKHACG